MSLKVDKKVPQKQKNEKLVYKVKVLDYAQIRNLKNTDRPPFLLPGLGTKNKMIAKKQQKDQLNIIQEPKLLTTAKQHIKFIHQQSTQSQTDHSNILGLSSFLNNREVTPNNLITQSLHKRKQNQKNKINSVNTQLFDIASNPQQHPIDKHAKIRSQEFRLYDHILGQSDVVYQHVFGRQRTVNAKLIHLWKDCLNHQDKSEIYLSVADQQVEIPYSHARIYPLNQIEQGFKGIFGTGKNRALTFGQEAVIIESIQKYLNLCSREPLKIGRKDFDIIQSILNDCKLTELQNLPQSYKQVQTHFKLLATKWRYSGKLNTKDRLIQPALIMGKNNFLDLTKHNLLTAFLLEHSNYNQI